MLWAIIPLWLCITRNNLTRNYLPSYLTDLPSLSSESAPGKKAPWLAKANAGIKKGVQSLKGRGRCISRLLLCQFVRSQDPPVKPWASREASRMNRHSLASWFFWRWNGRPLIGTGPNGSWGTAYAFSKNISQQHHHSHVPWRRVGLILQPFLLNLLPTLHQDR